MRYFIRNQFKFSTEKEMESKENEEKEKDPKQKITKDEENKILIVESEIEKKDIEKQTKDIEAEKTSIHHCNHDEENRNTGCKLIEVK